MYELYQAEWCPYSYRVRQRLTAKDKDPETLQEREKLRQKFP